MPERPYKCSLCHSTFRNESGMKWHIAHRHEIPVAFDALGKDYEARIVSMEEENIQKERQLAQVRKELIETNVALLEEKTARAKAFAQVKRLDEERNIAIMAYVMRDQIIRDRFNIELPNPYAK
ncbi:hypothetical protein ACFLX3_02845 [Chloroflexota bacterium]